MKITNVRLRLVQGTLRHPDPFWEERLVRPIDIYPLYRTQGPPTIPQPSAPEAYRVEAVFIEIATDEGVTGLAGPITKAAAFLIDAQLRDILLGADPRANELLWDQLYRYAVHGRKGETMIAISAVDCALWDLRGKWLNVPVYKLLGGPTREVVPAYASMLGFSVEPEQAAARAREYAALGFKHQKWFFRHGLAEGRAGMAKNLTLARVVREATGEDYELMFDCWMSFDVPYTIALGEQLAAYRPRWLEEPCLPDKLESYARIRRAVKFPISGGEHEYTRWGFRAIIEAQAMDVLQPDIYWCGGITETLKICALASTYDLQVIPHGHSVPATLQFLAAQPPHVCPLLEYLVKWNQVHQFFFKEPVQPREGMVPLPTKPGMGVELDPAKIEREQELSFR